MESAEEYKRRKHEERDKELKDKELHGQFFRPAQDVACSTNWQWLEKAHLKKETEGLIMAAQTQSLRTNALKAEIEKSHDTVNSRYCGHSRDRDLVSVLARVRNSGVREKKNRKCNCWIYGRRKYSDRLD